MKKRKKKKLDRWKDRLRQQNRLDRDVLSARFRIGLSIKDRAGTCTGIIKSRPTRGTAVVVWGTGVTTTVALRSIRAELAPLDDTRDYLDVLADIQPM